jgi:hypothetical protein
MPQNLDHPPLVELDDSIEAVNEFFETQGWTDGLPIIPPTPERVRAMYRYLDRDPDEVIATLAPRNGEATVERIAVNAVMAGARPEYLPVILAAVEAIAEEPFNLNGMQSTTHPCGVFVLVNGPVGRELNVNHGYNCFGQGWRANMTIGRTMRLVMLNIGGGTPGDGDRSTMGTPAKIAFCAAENEDASPWQPLHVEKGYALDDSTVTVMACEGPHNMQDHGSITALGLLTTMAMSMREAGGNQFLRGGGEPMAVFGPEHAATIAEGGYSKDDVKRFLATHANLPLDEASPDWAVRAGGPEIVRTPDGREAIRLTEDWSRINVIVAGGAGKHSAWIPTFGSSEMTNTVTRRIERRDGTPVRSIYDLAR